MKDNLHTLLYAVILGLICATALTAVDRFTADRKQANAKAEEMRNVLGVLGVPFNSNAPSEDLVKIYNENVKVEKLGELTTYIYQSSPESPKIQAIPFEGPGLWGPVKGFLSLDMGKETIVGITFYQQEETPGLGGEIAVACSCSATTRPENCAAWFRHQFKGKHIRDLAGKPGIRIQRDGAALLNGVDAITGATMTCDKVQVMLNVAIERFTQERDKHGR